MFMKVRSRSRKYRSPNYPTTRRQPPFPRIHSAGMSFLWQATMFRAQCHQLVEGCARAIHPWCPPSPTYSCMGLL